MSSIKKVLCVKAKNMGTKLFTTGCVYDADIGDGTAWVNDNLGRKTFIIICSPCIHGEWQPLEEYVCMTQMFSPKLNYGDTVYGYAKNGVLYTPHHEGCIDGKALSGFRKLSELNTEPKARYGVRHVVYDYNEDKIANDAMGECFIFLSEAQEVCEEMNAPKVMKPKYTKEVEYFGMKILVPDDARWLSTTMSGTLFAHCSKEAPSESICFHAGSDDHIVIGGIDLNGIDWKDTLVEIK
ncbi:hypothetical protein [Proteus phage vB_PmiP_RS51pmB]|nr:hypothetical protein [Proteus phage vB_PmiP_RS51pmB]